MQFDLPEDEVHFDPVKRRVRLNLERFEQWIAYVESLEHRLDLAAAETAVREAKTDASGHPAPSPRPAERDLLDPAEIGRLAEYGRLFRQKNGLRPRLERHGIAIRRLAELTRIPYTTLHRYISGHAPPVDLASEILQAVVWESRSLRAKGMASAGLTGAASPK